MIEILDENAEFVGAKLKGKESSTVVFALRLYERFLKTGRIPTLEKSVIRETIGLIHDLSEEIETGLATISPAQHQVIFEIYLPFLVREYDRISIYNHKTNSKKLGVSVAELGLHAMGARYLLNGSNIDVEIMPANPEEY